MSGYRPRSSPPRGGPSSRVSERVLVGTIVILGVTTCVGAIACDDVPHRAAIASSAVLLPLAAWLTYRRRSGPPESPAASARRRTGGRVPVADPVQREHLSAVVYLYDGVLAGALSLAASLRVIEPGRALMAMVLLALAALTARRQAGSPWFGALWRRLSLMAWAAVCLSGVAHPRLAHPEDPVATALAVVAGQLAVADACRVEP